METKQKYFEAVGRRKTATARVRLTPASKQSFVINEKDLATYFPTKELQSVVEDVFFQNRKFDQKFSVSGKINGGGIAGQASAFVTALLALFSNMIKNSGKN